MPDSWETFISGLESSPFDMLTPDYVIQKLKFEYERRQDRKEASHTDATEATAMVSKPNRRAAGKTGNRKTSNNNRNQETRTCYNCGKRGHLSAKCRASKKDKDKADTAFHADVVRNEKSLRTQTKIPSRVDVNTWCLDLGATKHMTNDRDFFSFFRKLKSTMSNADRHRAKVTGIGSGIISHRLKSGEVKRLQLNDVLYVPTLLENLLSVSRALKSDLVVHYENKLAIVTTKKNDGSPQKMIEADLDEDEGFFRFRTLSKQDAARTAKISCSLYRWHRRFGHRDSAAIRKLVRRKLVTGLELRSDDDHNEVKCCIRGKLAAKSFPCSQSTTEKPLELIHSDLCGPLPVTSAGGNRYILTFIDDYSRYTVVKLLKKKDEVVQ
ncbi:hypothetical protein RF55_8111 [Lasius niger]|uniref:Retrovirus-related pol polyprotein from transposon tnt 1-94 n=1 Tax=Lasius niger TaxID=67767 RepID=A0A0J7KNW8_LASNI|nr:hypothetical protein RF55_8111 [Lasius niger]